MVPFKTTNLNVSAAVTVGTTLSAQGIIYAQGGNSSLWNSAYTTVQSNSATAWNYQGTDLKALTGNWQNTSSVVQANSASWAIDSTTDTGVRALTGNWQSTYTTVQNNSATNWNYQGTDLKALSSNWQGTYTTVQANSANWNNAYNTGTTYQNASSSFATNTLIQTTSALLTPLTLTNTLTGQLVTNIDFNSYRTNVATATATLLPTTIYQNASGNWQGTYTTVQTNSASWGTGGSGIDTGVRALTGNWQGTYTTVQANSASWGTGGGVDEEFVIAMSIGLS